MVCPVNGLSEVRTRASLAGTPPCPGDADRWDDMTPEKRSTVVAAFSAPPLGPAVVEAAAAECRVRDADLLVLDARAGAGTPRPSAAALAAARACEEQGLTVEVRAVARGRSGGTTAVWQANEVDAELLVIGVRRRSPVGKLVLGSDAQDALLGAECAVLAVKVPAEQE
jgi:hypothetical protein